MNFRRILGAALLITGTSVGAGMLGLPVITAAGGFLPAIVIFLLCWFIMTTTGLLYSEICLKMPANTNISSMAYKYLGNKGRIFTWIVYISIFYCLNIAYISGGAEFIQHMTGDIFSPSITMLLFVIVFAVFVYQGTQMVDRINLFLMAGLIISYLFFVILGTKYIQPQLLTKIQWNKAYISLPIILVSFGYQHLIPTLSDYLKKNAKSLRYAIILGTSLTFIIYLLWEFLILGIIPLDGEYGLLMAKAKGHSAIYSLGHLTQIKTVNLFGQFFSFFAITTSFIGVSLGLFDFLSDGLNLNKKGFNKITILLITFLPPTIITLVNPNLFLVALNYAGGIGGSLLLVLLPALLVWQSRYIKKSTTQRITIYNNKGYLMLIYVFVCCVILINIYQQYLYFAK
ncbi:MAG: amino acid permease [Rickettsiales bacterium]|nr:amino acid permease [Rickettsiales bacterium]